MINEQQQELASLHAVGALTAEEQAQFERDLAANPELRAYARGLQRTAELVAISSSTVKPPARLKGKVLARIDALGATQRPNPNPAMTAPAGLRFEDGASNQGWKALPVAGAYIKLLSLEQEPGYAVLMGKLDPGTRYPAHVNVGPEDFFILSGDLVIGDRKMVAGDFHHADKGSQHPENCSVEGCTLLAVLTADHPLVALAMA
ncbi:MAG: cupin domain-containing protein [Gammaproteobacteria bacterium]